jgi:putative transposase
MARPLRVEYPGAFFHVTNRGNGRQKIFKDNRDREKLLGYLAGAVEKFSIKIHISCLMPNH